jgi:hypothetical protein
MYKVVSRMDKIEMLFPLTPNQNSTWLKG